MTRITASLVAAVGLAAAASAQTPFLTPLSTFGNNGFRAPHVILPGDVAGSNDGTRYRYLNSGTDTTFGGANLERGLAYNPATGNLLLVSRSQAGAGIRVLSGSTGADLGGLANQVSTFITGGTFAVNKVGVSGDGQIFVSNLTANIGTAAYKVYRWTSESDASPTVFFNSTVPGFSGTPRVGDALAVTGSVNDSSFKLAAGVSGGTTAFGAAVINSSGSASAFTVTGSTGSDFRLGTSFRSATELWGRVTSGNGRRADITTAPGSSLGVLTGQFASAGEGQFDITTINGTPYLVALDVNNSRIRIYDVTNPTAWVLSAATPFGVSTSTLDLTGSLYSNANATGDVKWGGVTLDSNGFPVATIYAMSTNQGIQAFSFSVVPAPGAAGVLAMGGLLAARRRRR